MYRLTALGLIALLGWGCAGEDDPARTAAELEAALDGASPGDTVRAASGTFRGTFVVLEGVSIDGAGIGSTILESDGDAAVVVLEASSTGTAVRNVTVRSSGSAGVVARGPGAASLEHVRVESSRGIGVGGEDVGTFRLVDVTLIGPVTRDNVSSLPIDPTPADTATHGIVLVRVTTAEMLRVDIHGYAKFGALFVESGVTWETGDASENVSTGMMAYGGSVTLDAVEVSRTIGAFTLIPPYNAVFAGGADVSSMGLVTSGGEGYGILHSDASGQHVDLVSEDNTAAGLWVQSSAGVSITGAGSRFANNSFAGVVALDSSDVTLSDASITATRLLRRVFGETSTVEVGDGIQLVRSVDAITLSNLSLDGNERAGLLVDLDGGDTSGIGITSVSADGTGAQLGVIAQNGTLAAGWDAMVDRLGETAANDSAFLAAGTVLDVAGVVAPTDMPVADDVSTGGLAAVGVVAPTD